MRDRICIILVVVLACTSLTAYAQESLQRERAHIAGWMTLGLGSSYFGPAFSFGVAYARGYDVFSLRYLKADEFQFGVEPFSDEPALELKEIGLMYGRLFKKKPLTLSISAGLGYVSAVDRGDFIQSGRYQRVEISTLGLPFEAGFRIEFGVVAIGGAWYGNISAKRSSYGAMVQALFGAF